MQSSPMSPLSIGFVIRGGQVPIVKECIKTKSLKPLNDYVKSLPLNQHGPATPNIVNKYRGGKINGT